MENNNTRSLSYFFKYFKPYSGLIVLTFVSLILAKAAATLEPLYLKRIIDGLTQGSAQAIIASALTFYFGSKFLSIAFEFLRDYWFSPVTMGVTRDIEKSVFQHLLKLPVAYHADQRAGAASRAVARGSRAIGFVLDFSVSQILPPIFELIFVIGLLLSLYSWHFGTITLATIVLYTWFTIWSTEKRQKYRIEGNSRDDQASGIMVDTVTNMDTVKYFNSEAHQFKRFSEIKEDWFALMVRNNRLFATIFSAQGIILLIGLGIILTLAVRQAEVGIMTVGDLVLVSTYIVRLSIPITTLGFVYGQYKNSFADLEAMSGILEQKVDIEEPENPITIEMPKGQVEFDQVDFTYAGRQQIVNDLSFTIQPGQHVAFVGSSGAGKSTLVKLLFRLYDVTKGEIRIDGKNIKDLSAETRRDLLGIVPQEPALFNDTIANNIRFGKPDAKKDEIITAAKAAHIHDFIESLPQGYDTVVGERGVKISGGEKQRVAIARAIIKDPKILIFDEATSSLDSKSEKAILATLDEVAKGRTTIAIAHRLSTIVDADVIYVLQAGKVVEQGTHNQLLKKDGVYAALWRLQSHGAEEPAPVVVAQ